jgi:hypothetical protein
MTFSFTNFKKQLAQFICHPDVNSFNRKIAQVAAQNNPSFTHSASSSSSVTNSKNTPSTNDKSRSLVDVDKGWQLREFRSVPVATWNKKIACLYYVDSE